MSGHLGGASAAISILVRTYKYGHFPRLLAPRVINAIIRISNAGHVLAFRHIMACRYTVGGKAPRDVKDDPRSRLPCHLPRDCHLRCRPTPIDGITDEPRIKRRRRPKGEGNDGEPTLLFSYLDRISKSPLMFDEGPRAVKVLSLYFFPFLFSFPSLLFFLSFLRAI